MSKKVMSKLALFMVLAMLAAVLGACGSGATSTTAAPASIRYDCTSCNHCSRWIWSENHPDFLAHPDPGEAESAD